MAAPEANVEMVVMARNLPTDCIAAFSIPGGSARDETLLRFCFLNINAQK